MASSTIKSELLTFFSDLLIIQYRGKPKAKATIEALVDTLIADNVALDIRDGFDLGTAVGAQLDILGKYIGIDRYYKDLNISGIYYGYSDYTEVNPDDVTGFSSASDFFIKEGKWLSGADVSYIISSLTDDQYRVLLKLKILQNTCNHSLYEIDNGLYDIFGTDIYAVDNLDMTMTYFVTGIDTAEGAKAAQQKNALPKPIGVSLDFRYI